MDCNIGAYTIISIFACFLLYSKWVSRWWIIYV